jgi:RNA polymerase sigma factor (sigma-70 family)
MGRDRMGRSDTPSKDWSGNTVELLHETFEEALRGDPKALDVLLTLVKGTYGTLILARLRHHRGRSGTATIEDVFQQSMVDFVEDVRSGALGLLDRDVREDVVGYFQKLCDRRLENLKRARLDPVLALRKEELPRQLVRDRRRLQEIPIPGVERHDQALERHQELLHVEIRKLDPSDRAILEDYLAGVPYAEISKKTGVKVSTLESLVTRLKSRLADRILRVSQTARLHHGRPEAPSSEPAAPPTAELVRRAIDDLPIETQQAIRFVHLEGGSIERLAQSLGARGLVKAQARLKRGYESLSVKLDLPFPDSFSLLTHG